MISALDIPKLRRTGLRDHAEKNKAVAGRFGAPTTAPTRVDASGKTVCFNRGRFHSPIQRHRWKKRVLVYFPPEDELKVQQPCLDIWRTAAEQQGLEALQK